MIIFLEIIIIFRHDIVEFGQIGDFCQHNSEKLSLFLDIPMTFVYQQFALDNFTCKFHAISKRKINEARTLTFPNFETSAA